MCERNVRVPHLILCCESIFIFMKYILDSKFHLLLTMALSTITPPSFIGHVYML